MAREQKQYVHIGLTAYRIGINYTNNLDYHVIEPVLKAFAREVGKTVFFGVRPREIIYIFKFGTGEPHHHHSHRGDHKNPLYRTSLGKAILAFEEEDVVVFW